MLKLQMTRNKIVLESLGNFVEGNVNFNAFESFRV